MEKIGAAIIGCGNRGRNGHIPAALSSDKIALVAVCDSNGSRARDTAESLGVTSYKDHRKVLERDDVEAVIIATDTRDHGRVAVDAARSGKHLLVEKPLAASASEAREVVSAVADSGVVGIVGYQLRFTAFAQALKQAVVDIDPLQVLLTDQRRLRAPQYFVPDHYAGVMDSASHTIHQGLWLVDDAPESVYATVRRGTFRGDQTIDFANLVVACRERERTLTVVTSMGGVKVQNVVQIIGRWGSVSSTDRKTIRTAGHRGFHADSSPVDLEVRELRPLDGPETALALMHDHFAALIRGASPDCRAATLEDGMMAVAITEAMAESDRRNAPVFLEEVLEGGVT